MKRLLICTLVVLLAGVGAAYGATINFQVTTDKAIYDLGEQVTWSIFVWASTDNHGIASFGLDLTESLGETLDVPPASAIDAGTYSMANGFALRSAGTASPGQLVDMFASQLTPVFDIGNTDSPMLFLSHTYTPALLGTHTLSITIPPPPASGPLYWVDTSGTSTEFETVASPINATFDVVPEPATMVLVGLGGLALLRRKRA